MSNSGAADCLQVAVEPYGMPFPSVRERLWSCPCEVLNLAPIAWSLARMALRFLGAGGGLWYTWFDRDLSLAGRVIVANADGKFESRLVRIDRSVRLVFVGGRR